MLLEMKTVVLQKSFGLTTLQAVGMGTAENAIKVVFW